MFHKNYEQDAAQLMQRHPQLKWVNHGCGSYTASDRDERDRPVKWMIVGFNSSQGLKPKIVKVLQ